MRSETRAKDALGGAAACLPLDPNTQVSDIKLFEARVREMIHSAETTRWRFAAILIVLSVVSAVWTWRERSALCTFTLNAVRTISGAKLPRLRDVCLTSENTAALQPKSHFQQPGTAHTDVGRLLRAMSEWSPIEARSCPVGNSMTEMTPTTHLRVLLTWLGFGLLFLATFTMSGAYRCVIYEPVHLVPRLNRVLAHFHVAYSAPRARLMRTERTVGKTWKTQFRFRDNRGSHQHEHDSCAVKPYSLRTARDNRAHPIEHSSHVPYAHAL